MLSIAALRDGHSCWASERRRKRREWLEKHITERPGGKLTHVLLIRSSRYTASMDQYGQMNCAQHSALNTTRECLVYRSRSLLTLLVFPASLHVKIHCATAFGRASLSTPFYTAAFLSALCMTGKLACLLALAFLLVKILQMSGSLLKPSVWQYWLNSWVDCLQGVWEG